MGKKCSKCGNSINETDLFCQKCGTKVEAEETPKEEVPKEEKKIEEKKVVEDNSQKPKKRKTGKIIVTIIILLLLITIGVLTYLLLQKDSNENNSNKEEIEEKEDKDKKKDDKEDKKEEKISYKMVYRKNDVYYFEKGNDYRYEVGEIPVVSDEIEVFDNVSLYKSSSKDTNYILYKDLNDIILYNLTEKIRKVLPIESNHDEYKIVYKLNDNKVYGIEYRDSVKYDSNHSELIELGNSGFFNLETGKKLYDGERFIKFTYVNNNKLSAIRFNSDYISIVDSNFEKKYLEEVYGNEDECLYYNFRGIGDYYISAGYVGCVGFDNMNPGTIYDRNMNVIISGVDTYFVDEFDNRLYAYKNNIAYEYDRDGKLLNQKTLEYKTLDVIKNYFLIIKNNNLVLTDIEGNEYQLGEWKDSYDYHIMISGYYNQNQLQKEQEKQAGIYLIVGTDVNDGLGGVEYFFDINTHEMKKYELKEVGGYAKPILYLYPEKETKVTVTFDKSENLTTTYPKYENKWEVTAKPNGDLYDSKGNYYYGLYWEENLNHKVDFSTGFYVEKDNAIEFLETKLSEIGLNPKEKNEFIMYWLPILEKNGKSLVYFELTDERNENSNINISPKPDSILRFAIHVKKVDKKIDIKEEKIPTFNRKGFVAVEWGGVIY